MAQKNKQIRLHLKPLMRPLDYLITSPHAFESPNLPCRCPRHFPPGGRNNAFRHNFRHLGCSLRIASDRRYPDVDHRFCRLGSVHLNHSDQRRRGFAGASDAGVSDSGASFSRAVLPTLSVTRAGPAMSRKSILLASIFTRTNCTRTRSDRR